MCGSEIDIVQRVINEIVSYKRELRDRIVHGLQCMEEEKGNDAVRCICVVKVKSDCNTDQVHQFLGCDCLDLRIFFLDFLFWFLFCGSASRLASSIQAISAHMPLFATFETLPFLSEGGSFVVSQGSPGTGTSRGKIHGIWVFRKTLLPLLSGGSLIWVSGVVLLLSSKISLVCEVFAMLTDSSLNPVFQGLVMTSWFKCEH